MRLCLLEGWCVDVPAAEVWVYLGDPRKRVASGTWDASNTRDLGGLRRGLVCGRLGFKERIKQTGSTTCTCDRDHPNNPFGGCLFGAACCLELCCLQLCDCVRGYFYSGVVLPIHFSPSRTAALKVYQGIADLESAYPYLVLRPLPK